MLIYVLATTTTTSAYVGDAYWSLDNHTNELSDSNLNANVIGSPTYTVGFDGYGSALCMNKSAVQYAYISPTVLPFNSRSFTIEAWIYPTALVSSNHYSILGQCQSRTSNLCLHFVIRNNKLYCGFYYNDIPGATTLTVNNWYHVACVYDMTTKTQQLWLDGYLETSCNCSPYAGLWGITTIGASFEYGYAVAFQGCIDNVQYASRAKNSSEILQDATLSVYYSFDGGSLADGGPNGANGTAYGSLVTVTGHRNQAIQFNTGPYISYSYYPFLFYGF